MTLELLDHKALTGFPAASGIEYFDSRIYVNGTDAESILVTDTRWKKEQQVPLFGDEAGRIPANNKADLESSAMLELEGTPYLLLLGSGSRESRNRGLLYKLPDEQVTLLDLSPFYKRLQEAGIEHLNLEGATQVGNELVLCNRGHKSNPANQFIITTADFFRVPSAAPIDIVSVKRPPLKGAVGVSGICYSERHDLLLFTTSGEDNRSEHHDTTIGNSYLGVIENAHWKIGRRKVKVNELFDLHEADKAFKGFRIESVCIQSTKKRSVKIQMAADNEAGASHLFKANLTFK